MSPLSDELHTFHIQRSSLMTGADSSSTAIMTDEPLATSESEPATDQEINLSALADKVYALLKQELRIERERLGRNRG